MVKKVAEKKAVMKYVVKDTEKEVLEKEAEEVEQHF